MSVGFISFFNWILICSGDCSFSFAFNVIFYCLSPPPFSTSAKSFLFLPSDGGVDVRDCFCVSLSPPPPPRTHFPLLRLTVPPSSLAGSVLLALRR
jgi:hypothetical protein